MPIFQYSAVDGTGQTVSGTLSGASIDEIRSLLKQRGLRVQMVQTASSVGDPLAQAPPASVPPQNSFPQAPRVQPTSAPMQDPNHFAPPQNKWTQNVNMPDAVVNKQFQGVPLAALEQFLRQISLLMKAGINAHEAFNDLSNRPMKELLKQISRETSVHTQTGGKIHEVFDQYPGAFSPFIRAMVRAGELGGFLPKALNDIANAIAEEIKIRNQIRIATLYPKLLFCFAMVMVLFINDFARGILGKNIYNSPLLEPMFWVFAGPLLVGAFLFLRYGVRNDKLKKGYDTFVTYIPFIGTTNRMFAMAKFGQTFGALMNAGVLPAESLELAARSMGNEHLCERLLPAAEPLRRGLPITATLESTGVIPQSLAHMMATGEATGQMDEMMQRATEYFQGEAAVRAKQMGIFLGILILVLVVLWIASMILGTLGGFATEYRDTVNDLTK